MARLASPSDPVLIIGAGVFGLSTALHLAKRGFNDITVLDKQPYDESKYSYLHGCDAASAGTCETKWSGARKMAKLKKIENTIKT